MKTKKPKMKKIGYISQESLWRLEVGGNRSRGTVPIHKKESSAARYPVYIQVGD